MNLDARITMPAYYAGKSLMNNAALALLEIINYNATSTSDEAIEIVRLADVI